SWFSIYLIYMFQDLLLSAFLTEIVVTATTCTQFTLSIISENIIVLFKKSIELNAWLGKTIDYNIIHPHQHIVLYGPIELEQENLKKIEGIGPNLDIEIRGEIVEVEENSRSSIEHRRVTKKFKIFKI
ncbi:hypothetical protein ACJX0J_035473, partial [Zea mays]